MATDPAVSEDSARVVEPYPEQEPFLWNQHRYYGFLSGVGAGKTAAGVMRAACNVEFWNPGEMGAIVAPSTHMVKNAIIPVMREFGLMDRWEYKGPQAEEPGIITPNDARIVILSADNDKTIERLASLNLAWWWLDEARLTPERARQVLIQRLRKGDYTNGFITTTPDGHDHNFEFFIGQHEPENYRYASADVYECEDRLAITGVATDANPHITDRDKEAIRDAHPGELQQQEVEGKFVDLGSGLLTREMLSFVNAEDFAEERELSWTVTADLGLEADPKKARENDTDYWAAAVIAYDSWRKEAFLVDIARTRGMTKDQGVGWLSGIMDGVPTNQVGVEANQAQRWMVQDLQDAGLNAYGIENDRKKEERLTYLSVPFANDRVRLVNHDDPSERASGQDFDPRWEPFVKEWLGFPNAAHDDLLDATEMGIRQLNLGGALSEIEGGHAYGNR